jgi:hypothetical protein
MSSYQYSQPMSTSSYSSAPLTSPTADVAEHLFWNPIPGMPGPILPRSNYQQISPMGLDSVLQANDMGERLGRDGFKMSEEWQSNHVNGFVSTSAGNSGFTTSAGNNGFASPRMGSQSGAGGDGGFMNRSATSYAQAPNGVAYQQQGNEHGHGQEEFGNGWYTSGSMS